MPCCAPGANLSQMLTLSIGLCRQAASAWQTPCMSSKHSSESPHTPCSLQSYLLYQATADRAQLLWCRAVLSTGRLQHLRMASYLYLERLPGTVS